MHIRFLIKQILIMKIIFRRDQMYRVRGVIYHTRLVLTRSKTGLTSISRDKSHGGRDTSGPYEIGSYHTE